MEMALLSNKFEPVGNENLDKNWKHVGSGGFGHVYKARHKDWRHDVAIKILKTDVGYKEADLMVTASSEFVLRVYGTYKGCPPFSRSTQHGIVMQFMEMGSVESLREDPPHPPPWPLAFRLAREVALGVNFLHLKKIVHQDLKPSNVLLTENLNARLADFGLSRVSTSALTSSSEQTGETGGTYKYMPPEAFDASYKPVRAFDIYSYGILLWSIVTGEEPYPGRTALVPLSIPDGQRPPCEDLEKMAVEGLKELVHLMKRCWDGDPNKRPKIDEVLEETEEVFSKHKRAIRDAVDQVLKRLDSPNGNQRSETSASNRRPPHQAPERSKSIDEVDMPSPITRHPPTQDSPNSNQLSDTSASNRHPPHQAPERSISNNEVDMPSPITRHPPTQGMRREVFHQDASHSSAKHMTDEEKENFVNVKKADLIQRVKLVVKIAEELGNMVNPETYDNIRAEKTSREQMRVLYTLLDSEGKKIKAAFYDALKRNHQLLVEDLGGF
ncbi:receptor-interacting serine/threonine-protein kinase 3-like isoform X1 [Sparus aurata]|uniref:receptor-interacting serine/threonine-protein kinase 3-like isoform X1 n=1 Tax=Sparus aurata TaxID=8175 RepID=UPI0011C0EB46|nr:receptor-interacting serine/threonine-protein kinase 3-like isoform X1 [Sparus aurata]